MVELKVRDLIKALGLEVLSGEEELGRKLKVADINRPGLVLAGFLQHFDHQRIQVLGTTEFAYLGTLPAEEAWQRWNVLLSLYFPCLIITRGIEIEPTWLEAAREKRIPLLRTPQPTTSFISRLTDFLEERLAPSATIHGVLVDVHGVGVLITGESGIGKSETALELVKRGHRLVADDAVEVIKIGERLSGRAPEVVRHLLEIRGLGILDIRTLFGAGAVRIEQTIHMAIRLEEWQEGKYYDRLGLDEEKVKLLGNEIPGITIPVRPGRNIASIIEVAAMNFRLKLLGHNAALELTRRLAALSLHEGE
ncbi:MULTISPECIES: HPr(Ser) kinase/phosphatase [Carboxydocella]|uniref:HPr kinase/phosphorylase n=2 Tax=Carboxydocella TaxID=178898 RepID=A0A1T4R8G7_9FIRM|nr:MULTISPECIES: HPr(Ser) kinase/phosphatase [Carboxydocella]AVX19724.1 Hpr(Ser) kinase/phosphatase [Carboxydocella thermautotrophica]AVX30135.1 Hpr(Ser) kinase/phosphatase [Carboxydocella thermautotrophica]SKA12253.1 Hpr(Ser) kinase/phosphatase [Carboxydocella sporoproducens DSM 16521]GAW29786.1 Hpr(Ser) kinase/phosphatase [Carboxydocella sp. ULO1]GAW31359.1 Hpr(Ser) kinase/phosphatase [Carboxydocella sp. JDF658]